jgi:X-X-X-Leu-X-X-Gly heptad repeat protein
LVHLGADGVAAGATLCVSGVGCFAGAPLTALGVMTVAAGADGAADGVGKINDGLKQAFRNAQDSSGEDSPESPDWIPDSATSKIPDSFGKGKPNQKGEGWRWNDGKGNGVRIDEGNLNNSQEYQQVDHVVVNRGGKIIGRNGEPIKGSIKENAYEAHIPLSEWLTWNSWDSPR